MNGKPTIVKVFDKQYTTIVRTKDVECIFQRTLFVK